MGIIILISLFLIFFCLLLIIIILIQTPKLEGGIYQSFLMNENRIFGLQSKNNFIEKITWFFNICIFLLIYILNFILKNK